MTFDPFLLFYPMCFFFLVSFYCGTKRHFSISSTITLNIQSTVYCCCCSCCCSFSFCHHFFFVCSTSVYNYFIALFIVFPTHYTFIAFMELSFYFCSQIHTQTRCCCSKRDYTLVFVRIYFVRYHPS